MHLAFLLRKEGQLVHTHVEANYYQASTLLIIRFYYVYLSCLDTRSEWHFTSIFRAVFDTLSLFLAPKTHGNACYTGYKVPSFEAFCDSPG